MQILASLNGADDNTTSRKDYAKAMNFFKQKNIDRIEEELKNVLFSYSSFSPAKTSLALAYLLQGKQGNDVNRLSVDTSNQNQISLGFSNSARPLAHLSEVYHDIYSKTKLNDSVYIAMQYSTLSITEIENLFIEDERKNIHFISNKDNFKESLKEMKYEKIFYDSFGGTFGHAYLVGNQLIAENFADKILKIYSLGNKK